MKTKITRIKVVSALASLLAVVLIIPIFQKVSGRAINENWINHILFNEYSLGFPAIDWFLWATMLCLAVLCLVRNKDIVLFLCFLVAGAIWYVSQIGKVGSGLALGAVLAVIFVNYVEVFLFWVKEPSSSDQ